MLTFKKSIEMVCIKSIWKSIYNLKKFITKKNISSDF